MTEPKLMWLGTWFYLSPLFFAAGAVVLGVWLLVALIRLINSARANAAASALSMLKPLFESGLLTEDEFHQKCRKLVKRL